MSCLPLFGNNSVTLVFHIHILTNTIWQGMDHIYRIYLYVISWEKNLMQKIISSKVDKWTISWVVIFYDKINYLKKVYLLTEGIQCYISFWILRKRSTVFDIIRLKVSKANDIKTCWLSEHIFSCLTNLIEATLRLFVLE